MTLGFTQIATTGRADVDRVERPLAFNRAMTFKRAYYVTDPIPLL
jgi:hypothetical protein